MLTSFRKSLIHFNFNNAFRAVGFSKPPLCNQPKDNPRLNLKSEKRAVLQTAHKSLTSCNQAVSWCSFRQKAHHCIRRHEDMTSRPNTAQQQQQQRRRRVICGATVTPSQLIVRWVRRWSDGAATTLAKATQGHSPLHPHTHTLAYARK